MPTGLNAGGGTGDSLSGRKNALAVAAVVCVVALLVLGLSGLQLPGINPEAAAPSKVTYNAAPGAKGLFVSVHAVPDHMAQGESTPIEVLVANGTTSEIKLHVSWSAPCFELSPEQPREFTLPASNTYLLPLKVSPVCLSGSHAITLYFWTRGLDPAYVSVASVAPIRLTSEWEEKSYRVFYLVAALIRALAIPGVLAWLAYRFQIAAAERDVVSKRKQDERDERLKQEQEARDRRESVLNTRIPEYSRIVQEHYLPISRRGDTIEAEMLTSLKEAGKLTADELKAKVKAEIDSAAASMMAWEANQVWRLLCAVMLYRARMLELFTQKGGIYFRSNQAERLYADLVSGFFAEVYRRLRKEEFSEAVALFGPDEKLSSALQKCLTGKAQLTAGAAAEVQAVEAKANLERFAGLFERFKGWLLADPMEFRRYTRLVQISSRILDFECDRPFYQTGPYPPKAGALDFEESGWYFDPPLLQFSEEMLEIPEGLRAGLDGELDYYVEHVPPACRRFAWTARVVAGGIGQGP